MSNQAAKGCSKYIANLWNLASKTTSWSKSEEGQVVEQFETQQCGRPLVTKVLCLQQTKHVLETEEKSSWKLLAPSSTPIPEEVAEKDAEFWRCHDDDSRNVHQGRIPPGSSVCVWTDTDRLGGNLGGNALSLNCPQPSTINSLAWMEIFRLRAAAAAREATFFWRETISFVLEVVFTTDWGVNLQGVGRGGGVGGLKSSLTPGIRCGSAHRSLGTLSSEDPKLREALSFFFRRSTCPIGKRTSSSRRRLWRVLAARSCLRSNSKGYCWCWW